MIRCVQLRVTGMIRMWTRVRLKAALRLRWRSQEKIQTMGADVSGVVGVAAAKDDPIVRVVRTLCAGIGSLPRPLRLKHLPHPKDRKVVPKQNPPSALMVRGGGAAGVVGGAVDAGRAEILLSGLMRHRRKTPRVNRIWPGNRPKMLRKTRTITLEIAVKMRLLMIPCRAGMRGVLRKVRPLVRKTPGPGGNRAVAVDRTELLRRVRRLRLRSLRGTARRALMALCLNGLLRLRCVSLPVA